MAIAKIDDLKYQYPFTIIFFFDLPTGRQVALIFSDFFSKFPSEIRKKTISLNPLYLYQKCTKSIIYLRTPEGFNICSHG
jgi:hypothetical protein